MSFLPLPPSFLRQLAEERLPRRSPIRDDPAPVGSRRPPQLDVVELTMVESLELEPALRRALIHRVARDRASASSVINEALRQYLAS
jgi:hypothetical protein